MRLHRVRFSDLSWSFGDKSACPNAILSVTPDPAPRASACAGRASHRGETRSWSVHSMSAAARTGRWLLRCSRGASTQLRRSAERSGSRLPDHPASRCSSARMIRALTERTRRPGRRVGARRDRRPARRRSRRRSSRTRRGAARTSATVRKPARSSEPSGAPRAAPGRADKGIAGSVASTASALSSRVWLLVLSRKATGPAARERGCHPGSQPPAGPTSPSPPRWSRHRHTVTSPSGSRDP